MKKTTLATLLVLFLLIPLTLFLGTKLPGRGFYLTGTLVIIQILIPFFLSFEGRKPQARELVIQAVLCAIAVASRGAFAWLPHFKPVFGIIMIAGIAFGPQSGFLVGAITAFASNFMFGQGPWTPWQMVAYGVAGLLAGFVTKQKWVSKKPLELAFFGIFSTILIVGPLLDTATVFTTLTTFTTPSVLAIYGSGVPTNLIQGICTFLTLLLLSKPLLEKLDRIKLKYGMNE